MIIRDRIYIYQGDTFEKEIVITDHQPDGLYRYIPEAEDDITLHLYTISGEAVNDYKADMSDLEHITVEIDSTELDTGTYLYDVIIKIKGECEEESEYEETHHIITGQEIIIGGNDV